MRLGMESEKLLFDTRSKTIAHTAYRILGALDDYKVVYHDAPVDRVVGEFVLNMIEMSSSPSDNVLSVAKDYLYSYSLVKDIAARGGVVPLPIASSPLPFDPIMSAKWPHFVQNAILTNDPNVGWFLKKEHKLYDAANCAGVHIHIELKTPSEFMALEDEFVQKHNMGALLVPFVAFASSAYFENKHDAISMRAHKYHYGIYGDLPFGGPPPVFSTPTDPVAFYYKTLLDWEKQGQKIGIDVEEIRRITARAGAYWGMVRWNRKWNTIEMRFLDTDFVDMDLAKLTIVAGMCQRMSEGWTVNVSNNPKSIEPSEIDSLLEDSIKNLINKNTKSIHLPSEVLLHRLIYLAVNEGLSNPLVYDYLLQLSKLASRALPKENSWLLRPLVHSLRIRKSTSDVILERTKNESTINDSIAIEIIEELASEENERFKILMKKLPFEYQPPSDQPFPLGELDLVTKDWGDWIRD